jgi:hypothetical protein
MSENAWPLCLERRALRSLYVLHSLLCCVFSESVSLIGTSTFCSKSTSAMALSRWRVSMVPRVIFLCDQCLEDDSLHLACLLQIRLSLADHLLPGIMSRDYGRFVHRFLRDQGSLVEQHITDVLSVCCTDVLSQPLIGGPHLVACCFVSIGEHVVFECLTEYTLLRVACASVDMAPSSMGPLRSFLPRPPRPLLFPLFPLMLGGNGEVC